MSDIQLACHASAWGAEEFVSALTDIGEIGYHGIETGPGVVENFEDRTSVFREMLDQQRVALAGLTAACPVLDEGMHDEVVERGLNLARFLSAVQGGPLILTAPPRAGTRTDAAACKAAAELLEEVGSGASEFGVPVCLRPAAGSVCQTTAELERFMRLTTAKSVRLCVDSAHLALARMAGATVLKKYRARVAHVHISDFRLKRSRAKNAKPQPVPVAFGRGVGGLARTLKAILTSDYTGWVTVDLFVRPNETPADAASTAYEIAQKGLDIF